MTGRQGHNARKNHQGFQKVTWGRTNVPTAAPAVTKLPAPGPNETGYPPAPPADLGLPAGAILGEWTRHGQWEPTDGLPEQPVPPKPHYCSKCSGRRHQRYVLVLQESGAVWWIGWECARG